MTGMVRGRLAAFFGPSIVSVRSLLWFFPIGVLLIVVTVPKDGRVGLTDTRWWIAAVAAQGALTLVIAGLAHLQSRFLGKRSASSWRAVIVLVGGAVRGLVLGILIDLLAMPLAPEATLVLRSVNSAIVCCLWLGLIGLFIRAGEDYRAQYRTLLARAVSLYRAEVDRSIDVEPELVEHWSSVQTAMRETRSRIQMRLGDENVAPTGADLAAAAAVVSEAVSLDVRPTSHGLWFTQAQTPPRLRPGALIWDALSDWRLPLRDIAVVLIAIAFVGSIIRAGLVIGAGFATLYVIFSLALLWVSNRLARQFPGPLVGIATVLILPWVLLLIAIAIGQGILNVQADNGGAAVAAVTTSIVAFGGLLLSRVSGERRILLEALQARIDHSLVVLLARQESRRESEQELGVFLHHSIQSELSALALQLGVAANSADAQLRVDARAAALERLIRIQETTPPWSTPQPGPDRIHEVVMSWEGIASIDVSLPLVDEGRPNQWKLVSQAVEESIANSIRAGHADRIRITVTAGAGTLLLEVADNGHESAEHAHREPGLGTAWLNSVAPGMWSLQRGESGSTLRVEFL
jgi:hypothetical protein